MTWIIVISFVLISIVLITAATVFILHRRYIKPAFMKLSIDTRREPCTRCSGGVQVFHKGNWGPVPGHMKREQKDSANGHYFGPPTANKRSCTCCTGRGSHFVDAERLTGG